MFAKKKETRPPSKRAGQSLAQYGLFDVPDNLDDAGGASEEGDSDFEAELAAIVGGGGKKKAKPKPKVIPQEDLDRLVADSLRDQPSDEDASDGEDDPDLLNELSEIAGDGEDAPVPPPRVSRPAPPPPASVPTSAAVATSPGDLVSLLQERIEMYIAAEQNAKAGGETGRARRFSRGLKTLKDQLKLAKAGKAVNEEEIPPVVSIAKHQPPAPGEAPSGAIELPAQSPTEEPPPPSSPKILTPPPEDAVAAVELSDEIKATLKILNVRKNEYKTAALVAKKSGDNVTALSYIKIAKQFDLVIAAVTSGQTVNLSEIPGPPGQEFAAPPSLPPKQEEHVQQSTDLPPDGAPEEAQAAPEALVKAGSVEEALQQRLDLYKQQESSAKEAGNTSKARRMGRIVKQFEQALKQHRAGKSIPYDELPNPPGYAPIPGAPAPVAEAPEPAPAPVQPAVQPASPSSSGSGGTSAEQGGTGQGGSVRKGSQTGSGHASRQLATLLQRQKEFKEAALNAKKKGEHAEAIEFLRCAKGLNPLIEASKCGLPVDLSSVPLPPQARQQLEDSYDFVTEGDCDADEEGSGGLLSRLEQQLSEQLKMCLETGEHHKAMGDVPGSNRFQHLALTVKQDLDVVRLAKRTGSDSLKFHYESKQFSVVQCCTDLGDNDLELTVVRGISYTVANPKEIDTYVKFEFPYPQEQPVIDKTALVKDTNSPEYNAVFTIPINRSARPCVRLFKRQAVKLDIYSRGGFFTRDSLIGTVNVKLQALETQTVLHDSFDLMNGRKAVGGKLEVMIRVRHPILAKQVEQITKKWLVIDH